MSATGRVISVHVGAEDTLEKIERDSIELALDGIVGDRHRGISRECWKGDKQAEGTQRRNERQWSAVSIEELAQISEAMGLAEPLSAATLGANLCLSGIPDLSRLARGTLLAFSSGAVLMVEEYNPPCSDMGVSIAEAYRSVDGAPVAATAFSDGAKFLRGVLGVVEVAGSISVGDAVTVTPERLPKWLRD
jgi:MOSC domain-containing protein YiiM